MGRLSKHVFREVSNLSVIERVSSEWAVSENLAMPQCPIASSIMLRETAITVKPPVKDTPKEDKPPNKG